MLVLLNNTTESATLSRRPASTVMAPNPLCLVWREQIIDNLRLISGRSAVIDIYTSRQPNKSYAIYAVKVHRGKRQEILSATGRDLEDAFENLHTKSSQEVYQFIEANGFAFPRGVRSEDSESSGSEASTMDASDVLSLSAGSDSDNDDIISRRGKKTKSSRRKSKRKSRKHTKDDSSSSSEEDVDSEPEQTTRMRRPAPGQRPSYIPAPPMAAISQPPPPPPGWTGHRPRTFPRAPDGVPPPPPRGSFPPGMRLPSPPQGMVPAAMTTAVVPAISTAPSKPVRLIINWRGHGEKKIVENCQPSHRALQRTALAHVRSQWQTFDNVLAQEMTPGRLWGLGAKVRKVALGKDMYSISAAGGDDLGMYFKAEDIPMFEVEVDHDGSIMPPPPPPQHHHGQR
ncbi:hypothetical protein CABS01_00556 [Colletotrichum abscissum]|uniref:Uncharacterized protein n=1 Tax=Colletotrichum abscissum TaxID=1671311 RepID=A0A9P9XS97_9PEZI|nr:uncharacterized protein CABS01_00556 [Colletotrichum abscissum]KAI3559462.1 hypothetical protein CABS02_00437 [Colletotrichum abscissum]KAK1525467.1 hypothetical protein CABS01_00556 [Colletotrichum abscissum]